MASNEDDVGTDRKLPRTAVGITGPSAKPIDAAQILRGATASILSNSNSEHLLPGWPVDSSAIDIAVGTRHFGILFEDGRVARIRYELIDSVVDANLNAKAPTSESSLPRGSSTSDSTGRSNLSDVGLGSSQMHPPFPSASPSLSIFSGPPMHAQRSAMQDSYVPRRRVLSARRPVSQVPDELVQSVMEVLPNKSRSVIVRQLQKTGLDVDSAIGLLLASGDDDDDEGEDNQSGEEEDVDDHQDEQNGQDEDGSNSRFDSFTIQDIESASPSEDGMIPVAQRSMPFLNGPWPGFGSMMERDAAAGGIPLFAPQGPPSSRGHPVRLSRRAHVSQSDGSKTKGNGAKGSRRKSDNFEPAEASKPIPYRLVGNLEFAEGTPKFKSIASLHTCMVLVPLEQAGVWQWEWKQSSPSEWERVASLNFSKEHIVCMSACPTRVVFLTASGRLASLMDNSCTFQDSTLKHRVLEHAAIRFEQFEDDRVTHLSVSTTKTLLQTESGRLWWMGLLPTCIREEMVKKETQRRKTASKSNPMIKVGDRVQLRSSPLYRPGAIGYNPAPANPTVGKLLDTAWNVTDKCRFELLDYPDSIEGEATKDSNIIEWKLEDIIFLRQGSNAQIGTVLKVDGPHAAVYFEDPDEQPPPNSKDSPSRVAHMWENSRLFKGDELGAMVEEERDYDFIKSDDFLQRIPASIPAQGVVITAMIHDRKFHVVTKVLSNGGECFGHNGEQFFTMAYYVYGWKDSKLQELSCTTIPGYRSSLDQEISFKGSSSTGLLMLVDRDGSIIFSNSNNVSSRPFGIKPKRSTIPAFQGVFTGVTSYKKKQSDVAVDLTVVICRPVTLLPAILSGDMAVVKTTLRTFEENSWQTVLNERLDGGRNILHILTTLPKQSFALECCDAILESPWLVHHGSALLCQVDSNGRTPIMAAIHQQAYNLASRFLQKAKSTSDDTLTLILKTRNRVTGQSLLHALCAEDLCSYDRTGATHVSQDVFECRTCNLVDEYCLCFACATYCHIGHDVRYKGKAPTAYCDCQDKKCCASFVPTGSLDIKSRQSLTDLLLEIPEVVTGTNFDGETALFSLVAQVSAAAGFGRNCSPPSPRDLRCELEERTRVTSALCKSWSCVKKTIMIGCSTSCNVLSGDGVVHMGESPQTRVLGEMKEESTDTDKDQDNTIQLDGFTYNILAAEAEGHLSEILSTMHETVKNEPSSIYIASRFVRSAVRVFSILSSGEVLNDDGFGQDLSSSTKAQISDLKSEYNHDSLRLKRCRQIFRKFPALAIQELAENSDAIIAPVRIGIVRPHGSFSRDKSDGRSERSRNRYSADNPSDVFCRYSTGLPPTSFIRKQWELLQFAPVDQHAARSSVSSEMDMGITDSMNSNIDISWATRRFRIENGPGRPVSASTRTGPSSRSGDAYTSFMSRSSARARMAEGALATNLGVSGVDHVEDEVHSMNYLSRLFSRIVKEMVDIAVDCSPDLFSTGDSIVPNLLRSNTRPDFLIREALRVMDMQLERCWQWLASALDATEAQLRAGMKYTMMNPSTTIRAKPQAQTEQPFPAAGDRRGGPRRAAGSSRPSMVSPPTSHTALGHFEFRKYVLSLMRAHSGEHGGCLPELDVSRTKHLAHVLDAFAYYLRAKNANKADLALLPRHEQFFLRSESIVDSGAVASPIFTTPFKEALPLADRPDRLRPSSSKSSLFGSGGQKQFNETVMLSPHLGLSSRLSGSYNNSLRTDHSSSELSAAASPRPTSVLDVSMTSEVPSSQNTPNLDEIATDAIFERWKLVTRLFLEMFLPELGIERESFLVRLAGFGIKEARFRERMEKLIRTLPESSSSDLKLTNLPRERQELLAELFQKFKIHRENKIGKQYPFLCREIKVDFKGEPGEGSGVVRSLLATAAESLLDAKPLPKDEKTNAKPAASAVGYLGLLLQEHDSENQLAEENDTKPSDSCTDSDHTLAPLFYAPGKPGYVSPVYVGASPPTSKGDKYRIDWFRYTGVIIGLSILHQHILPLQLCRHVLKFLLGRKIAWHDLAFFDPQLFESMRKTIVEAQATSPEIFAGWGLTFCVNLPDWLGGKSHNLTLDGDKEAVTRANVQKYVALYAQYVMIESVRPALESMRAGLLSVIPESALQDLTAEDLRLLLNGCADVDIVMLKRCTDFKNETGKDISFVKQTEDWFWEVVEGMSPTERHDLIYFWTSSPGLPATEAGLVPRPSVVVRPPSDGIAGMLPTANTCTSRLSLPSYPSIRVLKDKLLTAIKIRTFGFV